MINIFVTDESSKLKSVVLGTAESFGGTPDLDKTNDPKSREHIKAGTFPKEADLINEMNAVKSILLKHGVTVYRPDVLEGVNQIFTRDISFVIEDKLITPNIIVNRASEQAGIDYLMNQINSGQIIRMPEGAFAEGGDVIPWRGKLYIGYSEEEDFKHYKVSRSNRAGVDFLTQQFPELEVFSFELKKSEDDPRENALHLDCCFQPIGEGQCIIYRGGFKNESDFNLLVSQFGEENCIFIEKEDMYNMCSNVFSISPKVVISEKNFVTLNEELERRGFTVEKVSYTQVSKMEGLLRCSTLPLEREN